MSDPAEHAPSVLRELTDKVNAQFWALPPAHEDGKHPTVARDAIDRVLGTTQFDRETCAKLMAEMIRSLPDEVPAMSDDLYAPTPRTEAERVASAEAGLDDSYRDDGWSSWESLVRRITLTGLSYALEARYPDAFHESERRADEYHADAPKD